jgi:hypothetical protein
VSEHADQKSCFLPLYEDASHIMMSKVFLYVTRACKEGRGMLHQNGHRGRNHSRLVCLTRNRKVMYLQHVPLILPAEQHHSRSTEISLKDTDHYKMMLLDFDCCSNRSSTNRMLLVVNNFETLLLAPNIAFSTCMHRFNVALASSNSPFL